jgi:hypothetical protein
LHELATDLLINPLIDWGVDNAFGLPVEGITGATLKRGVGHRSVAPDAGSQGCGGVTPLKSGQLARLRATAEQRVC